MYEPFGVTNFEGLFCKKILKIFLNIGTFCVSAVGI